MEIKKIAFNRALSMLKAAGVKFAVIDFDGVKHGELEVVDPNNKPRLSSRFARGMFISHFAPFLKDLKEGQGVTVPFGSFEIDREAKEQLRSAIGSYCSAKWGNKTYMTFIADDGIEVLRIQ